MIAFALRASTNEFTSMNAASFSFSGLLCGGGLYSSWLFVVANMSHK